MAPAVARRRRKGGFRRQFGLDRSGPPPKETRPGQPLRPWTIPNLVGYIRLAALPVFLYLAFNSGDGRSPAAAAVYWLIAAGDYLDGFLARATGQYSRMGAILDPIVDRATILCGAAVCWHYYLLPRWAIAALVGRELVTLLLAQVALRRHMELEINWLGRIAVFAIMGPIFFTMVTPSVVWDVIFVAGVACAMLSTIIYARSGLARLRAS
jgi:cardiolipin synthase